MSDGARTSCARCGAYDPRGPAVEAGFGICAVCYEWMPPRAPFVWHLWHVIAAVLAPVALIVPCMILLAWLHLDTETAERIAGTMAATGGVLAGALMLAVFGGQIVEAGRARRLLAIPVAALEADGAAVCWLRAVSTRGGIATRGGVGEVALVATCASGLLVYGPRMRFAARWGELSVNELPLGHTTIEVARGDEGMLLSGLGRERARILEAWRAASATRSPPAAAPPPS